MREHHNSVDRKQINGKKPLTDQKQVPQCSVSPLKLRDWLRCAVAENRETVHGSDGALPVAESWEDGKIAERRREAQLVRAVRLALAVSKAVLGTISRGSIVYAPSFTIDSISVYELEAPINEAENDDATTASRFMVDIMGGVMSNDVDGCVSGSEDEGEDIELATIVRLGVILREFFSGFSLFPTYQPEVEDSPDVLPATDDEFLHPPTKQKRRVSAQEEENLLREEGLPTSICDLVSNLTNATKEGEKSPPERYTSLADVVTDLSLMSSQPERFLFGKSSNGNETSNSMVRLLFQNGKLYGHEAYLSELDSAYERIIGQPGGGGKRREIVLVSGYSGSGKSSVVQQSIQKRLDESGTHLIHGKFDERMQQAQPLSAVVSAFDGYCTALLEGEISGLEEVRSSIRDAIGTDSKVLTDLIPKLSQVIVDTSATPAVEVRGQEAQNRLNFIFCKFVRAISSLSHPVVLFLDDIHWADDDSLELIYMLAEAERSHFLLIGCYRGNEVGEGHPLTLQLQRMQEAGVIVTPIEVGNMSKEHANEMISDSLGLLPRQTRPLSDIVHSKTNGNALFVKQFVTSLFEGGFLRYSPSVRRWTWDIDDIRSKRVTDGVAELMMEKMLSLKPNIQRALMVAACLGSQTEQSILRLLDVREESNDKDMIASLDEAVSEGLMCKVGSTVYSFSHDSIQLAAYSLSPDKEAIHLAIGRQLWESSSEAELESFIFVVATQLDRGSNLITDHDEKIKLAKLNLKAGEKAIEQSAFSSASLYLQEGVKMLNVEDWQEHYDLCLQLHSAYAESLGVNGNWDEMRSYLGQIFTHAKCFEDKISGYYSLVKSLGAQNKRSDVIDLSLEVLSQLGESFPEEITHEVLGRDFSLTNESLEGTTMEGILHAEKMKNEKIASMKFLNLLALYLYVGRQPLLPLVIFRMVRLSLTHGICKESSLAFGAFALMVLNLSGDVKRGYRFGNLAISLLGKFNAKDCVARVHLTVFGLVSSWKDPMQVCLEGLTIGYEEGMVTGDVVFAMTNAHLYSAYALQCGSQLDGLIEQMMFYAQQMKRYKQTMSLPSTLSYLQFALNLVSFSEDPTVLTGEVMNQDDVLTTALENEHTNILHVIYILRMWMSYLYGKYDLAANMLEQCESVSFPALGQRTRNSLVVSETFYGGLVAIVMALKTRKKKWETVAYGSIKKLKTYAEDSPWNFEHKLKLLNAELFVLKQNIDMAKKTFDEAIESAGKHRFIHEQALACERAGIFHSMLGNHITADEYFSRSHQLYLQWGAKSKADDVLIKLSIK